MYPIKKLRKSTGAYFFLFIVMIAVNSELLAQTQIRGFVEANTSIQDGKASFGFGEQDLFITSDLNDNFSFLGESVFKFSPSSSTHFSVGIERIVIKYNYKGNHSLLVGKHHTPINYWNDTYHHGRVFFPTVGRPLLFAAKILPIHTTGIALQGLNLGKLKFGYNLMIGNGLGSSDIADNDKRKSISIATHIKPVDKMQIGVSYYNDAIFRADSDGGTINQQLLSGSISYFGSKFEVLGESTFAINKTNSTGGVNTSASYIYGGYKLNEKWIPYFRFDVLNFENDEMYFASDDTISIVFGLRHEINYLTVVKLEYQHEDRDVAGPVDVLTAQIAVGF